MTYIRLCFVFSVCASFASCATTDIAPVRTGGLSRDDQYRARIQEAINNPASPKVFVEKSADAAIAGDLSLDDAIRIAHFNNPYLQVSRLETSAAACSVREAEAARYPTISLGALYYRTQDEPSVSIMGNSVSLGARDNASIEINVVQPLYRGGAIIAEIRRSKLVELTAGQRAETMARNLERDTTLAYYDVLLAERMKAVADESTAWAAAHSDHVCQLKERGMATDYDVLRAEMDCTVAETERVARTQQLEIKKAELLDQLGVLAETGIRLSESFVYQPSYWAEDEILIAALNTNDALEIANVEIRILAETILLSESERYPRADAFVRGRFASPDPYDPSSDSWGESFDIGISASYLVFDGGARNGRRARAVAILRQKEKMRDALEQRLALDVKRALANLATAVVTLKSSEQNLRRAEIALQLAERAYDKGLNTRLEVMDARMAKTRAEEDRIRCVHACLSAETNLRRISGKRH